MDFYRDRVMNNMSSPGLCASLWYSGGVNAGKGSYTETRQLIGRVYNLLNTKGS